MIKKTLIIMMLATCLIGATLTTSADPNTQSTVKPKINILWTNSTSEGHVRLANQPWTNQVDWNNDFFTHANLTVSDNGTCAESQDHTQGSLVHNELTMTVGNMQYASQPILSHDVAMAMGSTCSDITFKVDSTSGQIVRVKIEVTYVLMVANEGDYWGSNHYSVHLNGQYVEDTIDLFNAGSEYRENTTTLYANIPSGGVGHLLIISGGCVYAPINGPSVSSGSGYSTAYVSLKMTAV
jgi:hypothetical protein